MMECTSEDSLKGVTHLQGFGQLVIDQQSEIRELHALFQVRFASRELSHMMRPVARIGESRFQGVDFSEKLSGEGRLVERAAENQEKPQAAEHLSENRKHP
jgi:hypothetical protein